MSKDNCNCDEVIALKERNGELAAVGIAALEGIDSALSDRDTDAETKLGWIAALTKLAKHNYSMISCGKPYPMNAAEEL